jgi:Spy/CpxP family protein refolding chaperone
MELELMRVLRRLTIVAGIALFTPALVSAQQGGGGAGGGGRMMAAMFNGITLSDAQQKQVDSIRTSYQPQMQSAADRDARRGIMQKETADFRSVLTPDQQSTFDKNIADMRSRMRSGGGSPQ